MQATATRFPLNVDAQDSPTISKSTFDFYVLAAGCKQVGFHLLCHTSEQYVFLANCFKTISSDSTPVGQLRPLAPVSRSQVQSNQQCRTPEKGQAVRPLMVETPLRDLSLWGITIFRSKQHLDPITQSRHEDEDFKITSCPTAGRGGHRYYRIPGCNRLIEEIWRTKSS